MSALVVGAPPGELAWRMRPSKFCVVAAVTKRLAPYLVEATVIPMLLFYGFLITLDLSGRSWRRSGGPTRRWLDGSSGAARSRPC